MAEAEAWREVEAWRTGEIESGRMPPLGIAALWLAGAAFLAVAAHLWGVWQRVDLSVWLFAAPGLVCALPLAFAVVETVRRAKYGSARLLLEQVPVVRGATLEGALELRKPTDLPASFQVALVCARVSRRIGSNRDAHSGGPSTRRVQLERVARELPATPLASPGGIRLPVSIEVPPDAPMTTARRPGDTGVVWTLEVRIPGRGLDLLASFELPMFR